MKLKLICLLSFCAFYSYAETPTTDNSLRLDWRDESVSPQKNFYLYANGHWKQNNPIPDEYASWGSFSVLQEQNINQIHDMLIQLSEAKHLKQGSIEQKIGDFYYSGMDLENINRLGAKPLQPEFDKIDEIHDIASLQEMITHLQMMGAGPLFGFGSMQDFKDSTKMIAAVVQGGLSLPDRDYYFKSEKKFVHIRDEFIKHMTKMFILLGDDPTRAEQEAHTVMKIETMLAKASMTQVQQRDPKAIYHMMTVAQLSELTPHFSWKAYLQGMGQPNITELNVAMPEFMKACNQALVTIPLNEWKIYLRWHLLDATSSYLSQPFVDQNFRMSSVLSGVKKILPRWKQVLSAENSALGFAIGELYVKKYFSPAAKQEVLEMIQNIRDVLRRDLQSLDWMTPATREAAVKKLDMMKERVGYPDKWRDYSSLHIDRGPYILNILRGNQFLIKRDLNKIGKPVDTTEWGMTPQVVNAYYDPSMNNINIPMGILRPPYFDPSAPDSVNYGAIGVVIGHEITHGFDDQGAQFDGKGNLHNWWTPEDLKKFKLATECISDQYSKYLVNGVTPLQGKLVVGEATADLGGLLLAYRAYHASKEYPQAKTINGLTPDQQFFLSFAHIWANNIRPEHALNMAMTDPHPPAEYRVNGTLANVAQFHEAYHVMPPSVMVNQDKCVIW